MKRYIKSSVRGYETSGHSTKVIVEEVENSGSVFKTQAQREEFYNSFSIYLSGLEVSDGDFDFGFSEVIVFWDELPGSPMRFDIDMRDLDGDGAFLKCEIPYKNATKFINDHPHDTDYMAYDMANYLHDIVSERFYKDEEE